MLQEELKVKAFKNNVYDSPSWIYLVVHLVLKLIVKPANLLLQGLNVSGEEGNRGGAVVLRVLRPVPPTPTPEPKHRQRFRFSSSRHISYLLPLL